nr:protein kinase [Streptomyces jietaisiensis]
MPRGKAKSVQPGHETDPAQIGRYRVIRRLGQGGMGRVYLARSPGGRPAAVKVINDHLQHDEQVMSRFRREVETLATVRSAFTAALIDSELDAPPFWLATEYVPGPTLHSAIVDGGPFPPELGRAVLAALAEGLADLQGHGVWHRDLKPHNVILSATGPQLIDFGIARTMGAAELTQVGSWLGTPGYMAPESITNGDTGAASDVFALGATLVFAMTGRPPFGEGSMATVSYRTVHEDVDLSGVDPDIAELIAACMHRDPEQRPTPQQIIDRCASDIDLVQHPAYQKALGAHGAATPVENATVPAGVRQELAGGAAASPTVVATRFEAAPGAGAGTPVPPGFGPAPAVPGGPPVPPRRNRTRLLVAGAVAAVLAMAAAAGTLVYRAAQDDSPGDRKPPVAGRTSDRPAGATKAPAGGEPAGRTSPDASRPAPEAPRNVSVNAPHTLAVGEFVESANRKLVMQPDGNLVVYDENARARWASQTFGENYTAVFQEDGNLVVYAPGHKAVWASNTNGNEGSVLLLLENGNVVVQHGSDVLWEAGSDR